MNVAGHFKTITRHRREVRKLCFKIGLYWQGMTHDLSKYSIPEFIDGCRYYQGDRSPNDIQRRTEGYSSAWLHHKGRNRHHFEYWTDYSGDRNHPGIVPVEMPMKYVAEMFCDRVAACKIYHGDKYTQADPYEYYSRANATHLINEKTSQVLGEMLLVLKDKGEDEACRYVKEMVRESERSSRNGRD